MALAIDGSVSGIFTSTTSGSVSLTAPTSGDLVVVLVVAENYSTTSAPTISSVTSTGLTFVARKTLSGTAVGLYGLHTGYGSICAIYWAVASGPLSAQSITVTMGGTIDCASVVAFAVSGANTSAPWDTNASLPATTTASSHSAVNVTATGVSTDNANTMLIAAFGGFNYTSSQSFPLTVGSGFTNINNADDTSGSLEASAQVERQIVSAQQSSATLGYSGTYTDFYLIVDAIVAAPPPLMGSSRLIFM